jgi:Asp-tRNA(Asn)/Glu-tRNA(Gln) amidotransferase A subunit family amidase
MSDIAFHSATRLAATVRDRKIGSRELLEHYLQRVERFRKSGGTGLWRLWPVRKILLRRAPRQQLQGGGDSRLTGTGVSHLIPSGPAYAAFKSFAATHH